MSSWEDFAQRVNEIQRAKSTPDPIADVAESIRRAEATAAPLADLPFALVPPVSLRSSKQGGLF